jgi:hypothetical protein
VTTRIISSSMNEQRAIEQYDVAAREASRIASHR